MQSNWSRRRHIGFRAAPFLRSCRGTRRTRTLHSSLLRCGERPGGHPDVASGRCGAEPQFQPTCSAEPAKTEKATAPLPLKFVIPVSRTQALHLLNRGRVFYLRGGGMVSSVVTLETRCGASVFSGSALRVPEAKRGRVPCDGAEEVCKMHALQT